MKVINSDLVKKTDGTKQLSPGVFIDPEPVYVSNENGWYEEGTICILIDDYRPQMNSGLFYGIRCCENPKSESKPFGTLYYDEEVCSFDNFDVHEVYPLTNKRNTNGSPEIDDMIKYGVR